ncbi:hypothetical protein SLEP1_g2633 [Rubroshorea leprosula]|uniref:Uncharacterized protein n=1 Tax=Rubroshorea leprosula TaxID=152421 RepID=A0AAV5HSB1_9ROSI|nr:hypothetical protein SLEP1_g2633 [Rubroshorea leprosula]
MFWSYQNFPFKQADNLFDQMGFLLNVHLFICFFINDHGKSFFVCD